MFRTKDIQGNIKYSSRSKAKVIDNRDPLKRGRIRIEHALLGKTSWIDYLRTPGTFTVPSIGDLVYVEADTGEVQYPVAWGNVTKGLDENPELPEVFKRDIPTNRGMYTPGGHLFEMDDGEATLSNAPKDNDFTDKGRGVRLTTKAGNKIHIMEDETSGEQYILLEDKEGDYIKLDYKDKKVTIVSKDTTLIDTTGDRTDIIGGAWAVNVTGNATINVDGNVEVNTTDATINTSGNATIAAGGNVDVTATDATINASGSATIEAGGNATFKGTGGTTVGDGGSQTQVMGSQVMLAGGGPGLARLGDRAFGVGNLGAPVSSTIIQGSTKVFSG
jgi:hypothetical protein